MVEITDVLSMLVPILGIVCGWLATQATANGRRVAKLEGWVEAYDKGLGESIRKIEKSVESLRTESNSHYSALSRRIDAAISEGANDRRELHGRVTRHGDRLTRLEGKAGD